MADRSTFVEFADYWVHTTPSEPDFWCGNQIILKSAQTPFDTACQLFEQHFPMATHRTFVWDIPDLDAATLDPAFAKDNAPVEACNTLALRGKIADVPTPDGIVLRALSGDDDWAQSLDLQVIIGAEDGYDPVSHRPYLAGRNATRRALIRAGFGDWFGAFDGPDLVANMGMFQSGTLARYQDVATHPDHRRRGIAAALLRHCCRWAQERAPDAKVVIVTEADSDASRLYRRLGFAQTETILSSMRPGY